MEKCIKGTIFIPADDPVAKNISKWKVPDVLTTCSWSNFKIATYEIHLNYIGLDDLQKILDTLKGGNKWVA